ncbi:MAG: hypothetical protein SV186_05605 [Candidatus Nanohaloarchaea archaeon]|nr:hypothetical protein [Candidatus Nanohaloarchaea archaeon]
MDPEVRRLAALVVLCGCVVAAAAVVGDVEVRYDRYTVPQVLEKRPVGRTVVVTGTVSRVKGVSNRSGYRYLEFVLGEGDRRLPVYCSLFNAPVEVAPGDRVWVEGTLKEYRKILEVSTQCFRVQRKG